MKTLTPVEVSSHNFRISRSDSVLVLGSCFAANIGQRMANDGYDVCLNPFGTIFNPASIISSINRLSSALPFTYSDCVQMGAGSQLWGSFSHYTRLAKNTREEFLETANKSLEYSREFYRNCDVIIVTFGTSYVFRHKASPETDSVLSSLFPGCSRIVSNCLKRPANEYSRELLDIQSICSMFPSDFAGGRKVLFTVSPIRHMADGAHGNQISKAILLMAVDAIVGTNDNFSYFPAYEILLDELRDYRWYAPDLVHPSDEAVDYIVSRFAKEYL